MGHPEVINRNGRSSADGSAGDERAYSADATQPGAPSRAKDAPNRRLQPPRRRRWRWLLVPLLAAIGFIGGSWWSAQNPPTYTAEATAFIAFTPPPPPSGNPNDQDPFGGSEFVLQRIETYAQLATSADVLDGVARDLNRGGAADLRRHVHAMAVPHTVILELTVDADDGAAAAQLANSVMSNLGRAIATLEGGPGQEAKSPVQLVPVQPAAVPREPERETAPLIGLLAGLLAGGGLAYLTRSRRVADIDRGAPGGVAPVATAKPEEDDAGSRAATAPIPGAAR